MNFSEIEVAVDGARAAITLNRPGKLNPLSTTTLTELVDAGRAAGRAGQRRPQSSGL